jgi:hypothetical protein
LEEALKRIRSGEQPEGSRRRKKTSRILLVLDAVLIIIILMFLYNREPRSIYRTTSFNYGEIQVRFSVSGERNSGDYLFSLTLTSGGAGANLLKFNRAVGTLILRSGDSVIVSNALGKEFTSLELAAGESRTIARIIERSALSDFVEKHPEAVIQTKRSLIQFEKKRLPVKADLILNTAEPVTVSLEFDHGVKQ